MITADQDNHWCCHSLIPYPVQHSDAHNINAYAADTCCWLHPELCDTSSVDDLMSCTLQLNSHLIAKTELVTDVHWNQTSMQAQLGDTCCVRCWLSVHKRSSLDDHMMLRIPAQQLLLNMGTCAVVAVHISHKVNLYHQMKQWSMSWAAQHFSSSADDVLWAECLSQHPQHYMQLCSCAALYDHQVIMFHEHMSQSSAPYAASVTQLCLHWCSAQLSAVLTFSSHWSQGLCVESDKAVVGEIWSASYFTINWWCLISILTCACIGVLHIWALYRNLGTYAEVPVHISHNVCIIRFSSDWWSGMCSIFIINWWCFLTILSQSPLYAASVTTSSTQMCLHWFLCTSERCTGTGHIRCCGSSAHQSQGLYHQMKQWLMIWDAQHIHHQLIVCRVRWSSGWWAWICILFHHQLMMFDEHTQLCLHWCFARLSAVLKLGTNAAVVPVHISHKVCIIRWSSDWWSGMRSRWRFMIMLSQSHMLFIVNSSHKIFVYLFTWSSNWWAGICSILHHHSCWNGLSSLCFWASKTHTLWQNDRYGCFKMKRHYCNSSLNLWINWYKNGR